MVHVFVDKEIRIVGWPDTKETVDCSARLA